MFFVSLINSYSCHVEKGQTTINKNQVFQKVAHNPELVFLAIPFFYLFMPQIYLTNIAHS